MRSLFLFFLFSQFALAGSSFDLRNQKLVTAAKKQSWGTCWSFSSIASIESNIAIERSWSSEGQLDLSEYHMDKFSGFNRNGHRDHKHNESYSGQGEGYLGSNSDDPTKGLLVHLGGDFKMATAYLSNIGGAVEEIKTPLISSSHSDHERFGDNPEEGVLLKNNYTYYLPKSVEWLTHGSFEEKIERIKQSVTKHGSVASSQYMQHDPYDTNVFSEEIHYYHGNEEPNHAVNIIGWDDYKVVIPFLPGVWIVQDSDHYHEADGHVGYFITPYADIYTGQDEEFGGISFRGVRAREFKSIKSYSLHGWQYEFESEKVSNIFSIKSDEVPSYVGVYAVEPNDRLLVIITDTKGNMLCHSTNEKKSNPGFYLLKLRCDSNSISNGAVRVELRAESGKYAHDGTKVYRPLLSSSQMPEHGAPIVVPSKANKGESFYYKDGEWKDFTDYRWSKEEQYGIEINKSGTGNFSINLYTEKIYRIPE